jgi:hypothetical protein
MTFIGEKIWNYRLRPLSTTADDSVNVSPNDCMIIAKNAINNYGDVFNAAYCLDFAQMVPTSLQTQNFTIDKNNISIEITYYDSANQPEYVKVQWYEKADGNKLAFMSTSIVIAKNGLVISLIDNLAIYDVATTQVNVSEEQAIDTAMPYIEAYAKENNRVTTSVNAVFFYSVDSISVRGNNRLIYPQWTVSAGFDNSNKSGVYGYAVMLWADNGEVFHYVPVEVLRPITQNSPPYIPIMIMFAITVALALLSIILNSTLSRTKSQRKNQYLKSTVKSVAKPGNRHFLIEVFQENNHGERSVSNFEILS